MVSRADPALRVNTAVTGDPAAARDHLVVEVVPKALTLCVPPAKGSPS